MADEEPVDQKRYLEDSCKPKCVNLYWNTRRALKGYMAMNPGRNTALDNILIIGFVLTNVSRPSYSPN